MYESPVTSGIGSSLATYRPTAGGYLKPMRPLIATLAGAAVAAVLGIVFAALKGEWRWADLIGTAAAFYGFRWIFLNGGIVPRDPDQAMRQDGSGERRSTSLRRKRRQ
jgi:hypothetical protein